MTSHTKALRYDFIVPTGVSRVTVLKMDNGVTTVEDKLVAPGEIIAVDINHGEDGPIPRSKPIESH